MGPKQIRRRLFYASLLTAGLFAIWTEDEAAEQTKASNAAAHHSAGKMAPSPLRNAFLAASANGGQTWSRAKRVNSVMEAIQSEENGPKIAFTADNRAYAVWSIPGEKGDKTRANIRFATDDGKGGFSAARTLNEVRDTARFPIIEASPDGNLLVAWIDRRIDNPKPRQLYLMRLGADGKALTKNYPVGEGLCECCKLGIAFADAGKKVYMVDREVNDKQVRNHVLRKSADGAASFSAPVEISDDGWQVPSCPHSGPSLGRDRRGWLHVVLVHARPIGARGRHLLQRVERRRRKLRAAVPGARQYRRRRRFTAI